MSELDPKRHIEKNRNVASGYALSNIIKSEPFVDDVIKLFTKARNAGSRIPNTSSQSLMFPVVPCSASIVVVAVRLWRGCDRQNGVDARRAGQKERKGALVRKKQRRQTYRLFRVFVVEIGRRLIAAAC